jgi:hypothetical protein
LCVNLACKKIDATFWVLAGKHPDAIDRVVEMPKKVYLLTLEALLYPRGTFFSFGKIWWDKKELSYDKGQSPYFSPRGGPALVREAVFHSRAKENRHCAFFLQLYNLFCNCAMYFAVVLFFSRCAKTMYYSYVLFH